mmetsp:Transcript_14308/g.18134  ORF Transcript_14308/g.18134 Transcript_14308/m.18134 type:complete len:100 (-) Transcript_14308:3-302(-)
MKDTETASSSLSSAHLESLEKGVLAPANQFLLLSPRRSGNNTFAELQDPRLQEEQGSRTENFARELHLKSVRSGIFASDLFALCASWLCPEELLKKLND